MGLDARHPHTLRGARLLLLVLLVLANGAPSAASAEQPEKLHIVGLSAGTDVPVMVGGDLELAFTRYLVPGVGVGFLPDGYVSLLTAFVDSQSVSDLIKRSLQDSLAVRFTLKSFPLRRWGLFASFSYTMYSLGGDINIRDYLDDLGFDAPSQLPQEEVEAETTMHLLSFGVGYRFWIIRRLSLTVEAAFMMAVGSSSSTNLQNRELDRQVGALLDDVFRTYVKAPVFSVRLGYHLF